ncbi:hypothetical protein LLE49_13555 [Alicyclobacillus tolerans]|uniref:hypothetical protein n=1 Tax=Alicyclobacillus tolerans TaxID=90970 RepID=UPI001F3B3E1C|nr:hypothetical protein [Alicyclobacillus tolerans]MCF8565744.1 hypothetical protein [Alicyclobacillus tolerans]
MKLQWVISKESTLYGQLPVLNHCDADIEGFTPSYCREYSSWDGKVHVEGALHQR